MHKPLVVTLAAIACLSLATASAQTVPRPRKPTPTPAVAPSATAPTAAAAPEKQLITMDFQDVEIGVLVKFISEITGKNFILDEKVRGKVTVISPTKITIDEAYRVFQSILEVKGFTTVPAGATTKIVPLREAKESGAPVSTRAPTGDQFITQLVPLTFVDASSLVAVLQPMVSRDGLITAYDPTNSLVLIDSASNVERLLRVISELDIEVPERGIEVIHLENSFAENIAQTLQEVLEATPERASAKAGAAPRPVGQPPPVPGAASGTGGPTFRVIPDERTNSLIVLAGPAQLRRIKALIKDLDKKLEGVSKIHVYALKYANAVEMVQVLSQLIGGGAAGAGGLGGVGGLGGLAGGGGPVRRTTRQRQSRSFGGQGRFGGAGGLGGVGGGALGSQLAGALGGGAAGAPGATGAAPVSATGGGGEFVGQVRVTADPYTNSLVISAGAQDYDVLKRVVDELDVPRRQVFVEAIILEISLDKTRDLGIELQGGAALDGFGDIGFGRANLKNLNTALTNPASLSGLVMAAASKQTVTINGPNGGTITVPAQAALLTALESDTDVNILSAPTILTSDNQEAEILVGQNIPFIASRATDTTNLANTFATVDRQDVGITLRLTPQISQGDVVRLDLYEEVSAVVPNPPVDPNIAGPTTTVRSASTTIVARDGHTVALGGLISDNTSLSESKVPYLGDIPVLGNLFKTNDDKKNKVNLLIFLTPHVIHDEVDLRQVSTGERDKFRRTLQGARVGPRRKEQLENPSWEAGAAPLGAGGAAPPILRPAPAYVPPTAAPRLSYAPPAPAPAPSLPPPSPAPAQPTPYAGSVSPSSPSALGIPASGYRFVILLSLWENGAPPPELQTANGFLTVYLPEEGADFFEKGGTYEYKSPQYEAKYSCLEVFAGAAEALAVYPEGQPLERWGGAVVRWKPITAEQKRRMIAGLSPWKRIR